MGGARGRVSSRTEVAVGPSKGMGQSSVCHPHVGMCLEQSRKKCGSKGSIRPYIHSLDVSSCVCVCVCACHSLSVCVCIIHSVCVFSGGDLTCQLITGLETL